MLKGIQDSAAFILFLSEGVLTRPYCQMEIREAHRLEKQLVLIHESDARFGELSAALARSFTDSSVT